MHPDTQVLHIPQQREGSDRREAWHSETSLMMVVTEEVRDAHKEFAARLQVLNLQPPCRITPQAWDSGPDTEGNREGANQAAERVADAIRQCRKCLVRYECDAIRRADPQADGVYAGEYYNSDNRQKQRKTREALRRLFREGTE